MDHSKLFFLALWLLTLSTDCLGMIGFECGIPTSNITSLSLLEVDECDIPAPSLNVSSVHIQLLQINEYGSVHIYQCKVEVDRDVRKCGMFSHTSDVVNGKAAYVFEIGKDACMKMHEFGSFGIDDVVIMGIKGNQTSSYPVTLAGQLSVDGTCKGTSYTDPYGSWSDVIVLSTLKITLRDYQTSVSLKTNKVFLKSGIRCALGKGYCMDMEGGQTYWNPIPRDQCGGDEYGVLYMGMAEKGVDRNLGTLYTVTTSDIIFALVAHSTITVCGQSLIRTEHPRLLVHEVRNGRVFLRKRRIDAVNMDIYAYVNSKFVYIERHIQTQTQQVYTDLLTHKCELEREMLRNRLAIAAQAPDEFAFYLMKGPGYMAVIAGEVIHIVKCVATEVKIRHLNECYAHLPVMKGNEGYFLSPKTHVLLKTGLQITCNRLVPPMYLIDEEWYGMMPEPSLVYPPETMKPNTKPTWKYSKSKGLATNGIYTLSELEQLREHVMFPAEKPAMLNSVVRGMMGKPTIAQGESFVKLLNGPEFEKFMHSSWKKMWEKLIAFGHISAGLIGIVMVIRGIKLIIDTIIHGYALHTVYGWSLFLLGAVWDSVTNLLLHLKKGANKQPRAAPRNKEKTGETDGTNEVNGGVVERDVELGERNRIDEERIEGEHEYNDIGIQTVKGPVSRIYPRL